jgi:hypothetical protein
LLLLLLLLLLWLWLLLWLLLGFAAVASLTSPKAKDRHLDQSDSRFYRGPRSGENPRILPLPLPVLLFVIPQRSGGICCWSRRLRF